MNTSSLNQPDAKEALVTVVVPTYNRASVIYKTVESVLAQTHSHWELIIVDDCSKDTQQLLDYVNGLGEPRISVIQHEVNRHGSAARNTGIRAAKGAFIALLDSDDVWHPEHLQKSIAAVGSEETVVYCQVNTAMGILPTRPLGEKELVCDYLLSRGGLMQTSSLVMTRALAQKVLFDETLVRFQDLDFAIRLQNGGATFTLLNECLVEMTDADAGQRISNQTNVKPALYWLDRIDPLLSDEAAVAFYVKRIARLHVISYNQRRIFDDMPVRVRQALGSSLALRLRLYSVAPTWFIRLARYAVKTLKAKG